MNEGGKNIPASGRISFAFVNSVVNGFLSYPFLFFFLFGCNFLFNGRQGDLTYVAMLTRIC